MNCSKRFIYQEERKIEDELNQINFLFLQKIEYKNEFLEEYEKHLFHENLLLQV